MADLLADGPVLVLSSTWDGAETERSFVMRSLAGAISGRRPVVVLAPGPLRSPRADGLFDVHQLGTASPDDRSATASVDGIGTGSPDDRTWPLPGDARWPAVDPPAMALVHVDDAGAMALAREFAPSAPLVALAGSARPVSQADALITVTPDRRDAVAAANPEVASEVYDTGLHVPVNPFVTKRPHSGIGFVDYLLALSDRVGGPSNDGSDPTPWVAWLAARFPRQHTMVIEDGVATVWQWRSRRGAIDVETRTDLWRLFAHARGVIDLRPGPLVARECVEAQLVGTPIVAPTGSIGAEHAAFGGGLCFSNVDELLRAVDSLEDRGVRDQLGKQGRAMAEDRYGHPDRLVDRMAHIVASVEKAGPRRSR
ncbi:MAG TPA: hypothetical protein VGI44_13905 [Acidimicrobiales bacterium]